jgi:eukaryotic-like serine/threonine-protein kinase
MDLWTEYEGRTIDGVFPLTKLLRSEGRSAFFFTSNGTGVPRIIRLIEPHFDEDEILARWRGVAALDHPNILKLEKYGRVTLDDASLVYAVMEPVDASLEEVVTRQRLSLPEARQLAVSLVAVIESLHTHGFVHEHIEPANVFAVGEVVKLRSDCIRETPEGEEGRELKRRDLHDLAVVLLQALTQEQTLEAAARNLPLPTPFDQIVRKGMSAEWGVTEITAALQDPSQIIQPREERPAAPRTTSSLGAAAKPPESKPAEVPPSPDRIRVPVEGGMRSAGQGTGRTVVIGLMVILVLWLGWHFLHNRSANQSNIPQKTSMPAPVVDSGRAVSAAANAPVKTVNVPPVHNDHPAPIRDQWRVVVYTYNHEIQAQQKSATVAQRHPELRPEVFTPNGQAPYLVTVGGPMSRDEAFALAEKVRKEGLPHDAYAQNYHGKEP